MANPRKPARKRRHRPARVQRDARRTGATHLAGDVVAVWATGLMGGSFEGKPMSAIAVAQMTRNNAPCWVAHEFWSSAARGRSNAMQCAVVAVAGDVAQGVLRARSGVGRPADK